MLTKKHKAFFVSLWDITSGRLSLYKYYCPRVYSYNAKKLNQDLIKIFIIFQALPFVMIPKINDTKSWAELYQKMRDDGKISQSIVALKPLGNNLEIEIQTKK